MHDFSYLTLNDIHINIYTIVYTYLTILKKRRERKKLFYVHNIYRYK